MATSLPPFPTNSQPGSFVWVDWFKKLEGFIIDVTDVSDSGTIDPGSIIVSGPTGDVTGYFQRIGNQVTFVFELSITGDFTGTVTFDLGRQFPRAQYRDTVTHVQPLTGGNDGIGFINTNTNKTVTLFNISVTGGTGGNPIIVSGRYFSV